MRFNLFCLQMKRAFKLPFKGESRWRRLLVGSMLWALPIGGAIIDLWAGAALLLPAVILTGGYCLRVMKAELSAPAESPPAELPPWNDWLSLARDGSYLLLLAVAHLAALVVVALTVWLVTGLPMHDFRSMEGDSAAGLVNMLFILLATLLVAEYIPLMAAHVAKTGDFNSAFDWRVMLKRMFDNHDACYTAAIGSVVLLELSLLGLLLFPLLPLAVFASQMISANLWAQAYKYVRNQDEKSKPK